MQWKWTNSFKPLKSLCGWEGRIISSLTRLLRKHVERQTFTRMTVCTQSYDNLLVCALTARRVRSALALLGPLRAVHLQFPSYTVYWLFRQLSQYDQQEASTNQTNSKKFTCMKNKIILKDLVIGQHVLVESKCGKWKFPAHSRVWILWFWCNVAVFQSVIMEIIFNFFCFFGKNWPWSDSEEDFLP